MIKLKNVSKFYYSKGVIASGFSKVNLQFDIGEFVAITGESGSGKSTLLNVISGLDSYEEGEMYINGEETSHYSETDFENYRRKYICNIFQSFNLINSYTVYQNVELVLLLNGHKRREVKKKVLDIIEKVDLYKFRNTKVSKLSGGQKQRVAIARALAKETPILVADEPTGNLDSESAKSVLALLSEIAKDKLVIIVTHNYDQIEEYVTRKIKMHDGKVLEDKQIKEVEPLKVEVKNNNKNITFTNKFRLGFRNTFNIIPKFLLLFGVYFFIIIALLSQYSSFTQDEYQSSTSGYNWLFQNNRPSRIIIKKQDGSSFTDEDYAAIKKLKNVSHVVENDLLLDNMLELTNYNSKTDQTEGTSYIWLYGNASNIGLLEGELDVGRMPENDNELVVEGYKRDYYIGEMAEELLKTELYLQDSSTGQPIDDYKMKIVGIKYLEEGSFFGYSSQGNPNLYLSDTLMEKLLSNINQNYSTMKVLFQNKYYDSTPYSTYFQILPSDTVEAGKAIGSSDLNYMSKNNTAKNKTVNIYLENLYYKEELNLTISNTYIKSNFKKLTGYSNYDTYNGAIFINRQDYNSLFDEPPYQSSVFVEDVKQLDATLGELNAMGIDTLAMRDALVKNGEAGILRIFKLVAMIGLVIALFFISYFIIRIILKSRNVYFSTIRILGATRKVSMQLLIIELLTTTNSAFLAFLALIALVKKGIINVQKITEMISFLTLRDYVLVYIVLITMSYLITLKFSKKLFKQSAMKAYYEEV